MVGWLLVAVGLAIALVAAAVLFRFSGWLLPWLKGTLGLAVVLAGLLVMAVGWTVLQWQPVSPGQPLYRLSVLSEANGAWRIEMRGGETLLREEEVRGELLEVTGRLLVLEAPLGDGGALLLYRGDSIRGYGPEARPSLQFNPRASAWYSHWIDIWNLDRRLALPMIRAESLYPLWVPMVDGAVFEVVLQGNQIVPIAANDAAEQALEELEERE